MIFSSSSISRTNNGTDKSLTQTSDGRATTAPCLLECAAIFWRPPVSSMSRLNPRQQEARDYVGGPLLVLAGAGSGKTSVITRKIAHLIQNCGIRAQYIVAMTFTNKAAREMKERVATLLRPGEGRGLTVCTFHNLGLNIIRKEHERLAISRASRSSMSPTSRRCCRTSCRRSTPATTASTRSRT